MTDNPPNVLWICTDQQRWDTLGCYGNTLVRTPNVDSLARNGVQFDCAFTQSPVCTPSRAAFLTGRYPRTTRCRQNGQKIPESEITVTRLLSEAGYDCGLSGKLHLSHCQPKSCPRMEERINDGYSEFHWSHHPNPDWPANEYIHWLRDKGVDFRDLWGEKHPSCNYVLQGMPAEHHQTTWCAQKAINFIRAREKTQRPWLFSANIFDPHHAFDPPSDYLERYKVDDVPLPGYREGELDNKPHFQKLDHEHAYNQPNSMGYPRMSESDHRWVRAAYFAMCDLIDAQVGRMIEALKETGQLENTIVIFMSDHGEMLGDHGIYLKGPYFYEEAMRMPLVVNWPAGFGKGLRTDAIVELVDIAPMLLEVAGLPVHPGMQGKSIRDICTGQADPSAHRDFAYCEYYNALPSHRPPAYATTIRTRRHKLAVFHGSEPSELYDLEADPGEHDNLWDAPAAREIRDRLMKRCFDKLAFTLDPLPLRKGNW